MSSTRCSKCGIDYHVSKGGKCLHCHGEEEGTQKCKECGLHVEPKGSYYGEKTDICFICDFWHEKILIKDRLIIADHHTYIIGGPGGFGGHHWKIEMMDGRVIETNQLWHNGEIQERFWDRLPDNAHYFGGFRCRK